MYAVISSPTFFKEIEQTVISKNDQISFKKVDNDIFITNEFEQIGLLSIKYLIIDLTALNNSDENIEAFVRAIKKYRIMNDKTQIIIIAPNYTYPDKLINQLVVLGIYNIIAPENDNLEDIVLLPTLLNIIDNPAQFKNAVKWLSTDYIVNDDSTKNKQHKSSLNKLSPSNVNVINKEVTKTVTITKEKIIGSVVIGITGTMNRIGTTHTAISIANFLKQKNFKICILEYHDSNNFNLIKNSYEDVKITNSYFTLNNIDFYPYTTSLNILDVIQCNYNYIILDLGVYSNCDIQEFKRSDVKIIISGAKDWEISYLEPIIKENDNLNNNLYYFNFADNDRFDFIKSNMHDSNIGQLKCFQAVYNPNPFLISKDSSASFHNILKDVLPNNNNTSNKTNIFRFLKKKGK